MFIPNLDATLLRRVGTDINGDATFAKPIPIRLAIININITAKQSPVRTDMSASRGRVLENSTTNTQALIPKTVELEIGDQLVIDSIRFIVDGKQPRHSVQGCLDHYQLMLRIFQEDDAPPAALVDGEDPWA